MLNASRSVVFRAAGALPQQLVAVVYRSKLQSENTLRFLKFQGFPWILARTWAVRGRIWVHTILKWPNAPRFAVATPRFSVDNPLKSAAPNQGLEQKSTQWSMVRWRESIVWVTSSACGAPMPCAAGSSIDKNSVCFFCAPQAIFWSDEKMLIRKPEHAGQSEDAFLTLISLLYKTVF